MLSASFSNIDKFLIYVLLSALGQSDHGKSEIFDENEFSGSPRPFPPKYRTPREHILPCMKWDNF